MSAKRLTLQDETLYYCCDCQGQHHWNECPLKGLCLFCKTAPATLHFGDMLSVTHGGGLNCCELCCAEKQLAHARERAALIPSLEARVAALAEGASDARPS
ncbi:MAG: hypothetical protein NUW01_04440 [Gemmatimonadaceae bacterium]|nr:hypothetical protein [Gemmatimonadaceae bacterium]